MKQREARRAAYGVVSDLIEGLLSQKVTPPLLRPDGSEFEGQDQIKIIQVLKEMRVMFLAKTECRHRRSNVRKV